MSVLGPGQKPNIRSRYPHLLPEDTAVWSKFLNTDTDRIIECWYDVRIGQSVLLGPNSDEMDQKIASGLTRKRIDVICRVEDGFWVVEIKPYANMYAMGQILTYVRLFTAEYTPEGEITPVLVCDNYDDDLLDEFDEFGILVIKNE